MNCTELAQYTKTDKQRDADTVMDETIIILKVDDNNIENVAVCSSSSSN